MTLQCSVLNFLIYEENLTFFFISVQIVKFAAYAQDDPRFGHDYDGYGYGGTPPPDYASANPVGSDEVKHINKYFQQLKSIILCVPRGKKSTV
jgi:hypothetical protein